jgi:nucleoside-diphosphate-sugar epimerase
MVVGNGMMARRFLEYAHQNEFIIFASGVSNSKETNEAAFVREVDLLTQHLRESAGQRFVYFSTCSIADASMTDTQYVKHKIKCEELIKAQVPDYVIFRVSNVVGAGGNSNTIINFLVDKITTQQPFAIWQDSVRNIIDVDDVFAIANYFIRNQKTPDTIVIANTIQYKIGLIVSVIEDFLAKKGIYEVIKKGSSFDINTTHINAIATPLGICFDSNYLKKLLKKYF